MAVQDALQSVDNTDHQGRLASWSGIISWSVYGLVALLVIALIAMFVSHRIESSRVQNTREAWDEVYRALKEKQQTPDRIAALEGVWESISGSAAHPFVMMELAQAHWEMGLRPERSPAQRKESLHRAGLLYDLVLKHHGSNPSYGALAAEGAAAAREQAEDLDAAIQLLTDSIGSYDQHFLYPKLCYDLGRLHWLRALKKESANADAAADRRDAVRWLGQAVREGGEGRSSYAAWRAQAKFLKSLLDKPGPALPEGVAPPEKRTEAKPVEVTIPIPPANSSDAKSEKKPEAEKAPAVEKKTEAEKKPEAK